MFIKRSIPAPRFGEFVARIAMIMALVALSTDAVLPALPDISKDLAVYRENSIQLITSLFFLGMAIGQIFYGPWSDKVGRKLPLYLGYGIYIIGCILSLSAVSFSMMLTGRFMQGLGAAGPRTIILSLVRDQYEGRIMARVMSFVMTVFVFIPIIAPGIGQTVLFISNWRAIFGIYLIIALINVSWFGIRQPETLLPEKRTNFSLKLIGKEIRIIFGNRIVVGYTLIMGLIFGSFLGYLNSAQPIFQDQYALGTRFPLFFALLSISIGSAALLNARLVMRYGMSLLVNFALYGISGLSIVFFLIAFMQAGHPSLWILMTYMLLTFFCIGILFGNMNALAMQPLGNIAGIGAAVIGSVSTIISFVFGTLIGQSYNGTVLPLVGGFCICNIISLGIVHWAENKKQAQECG